MKFNYKLIKPIRKSKGLTQGDVQDYLSQHFNKPYNRSTISSKECGRNPFNLEEIEALAEYFDVELTAFFDGAESQPQAQVLAQSQPQAQQEIIDMNLEMQTYLLQRVKELEERLRFYENPQNGNATLAKHSKR